MADFSFTENDTGSVLQINCVREKTNQAIDLTGATVTLIWIDGTGTKISKAMTIVDAVNGIVKYQFLANELIAPKMTFTVQIEDSSGKILHSLDYLDEKVRRQQA